MKLQHGLFLTMGSTVLAALLALPASAGMVSASDNATVQPGGPRSGSSGKAFFNLEGDNNATFASFGVADFTFPGGDSTSVVDSATLKLTQSNAGFSTTGPISIYYTTNTSEDIQPGASIAYQSGNNGAASIDSAFSPLTLLGSGTYTVGTSGDVDSFPLTFTGGALTDLLSAINSGGTVRLIVTPDDGSTAATYAGYTNSSFAGPTLCINVPEPATLALAGLLAVALTGCARRNGRR